MSSGGSWVEVPGKGRRWLTDKGEYKHLRPGTTADTIWRAVSPFFTKPRYTPEQFRALSAPGLQRSPAAENPLAGDPTGRYIPVSMQRLWEGEVPGAPPAPQLPPPGFGTAPIVYGSNGSGGADRRKSDVYKQYAMTPEGQFQRYFSTGEMDPFFGATSRGTGSPQTAAEIVPGKVL